MSRTGHLVRTGRGYEIGLVRTIVAADEFEDRVDQYATAASRIAPRTASAIKHGVNRAVEIAGLKFAIESWADRAALLHDVDDAQITDFRAGLRSGNVAAAIAARNQFHGGA